MTRSLIWQVPDNAGTRRIFDANTRGRIGLGWRGRDHHTMSHQLTLFPQISRRIRTYQVDEPARLALDRFALSTVPHHTVPPLLRPLANAVSISPAQTLSAHSSILFKTLACLILLLLVIATPVRGETAITVGSEQPSIDRLTESFQLAPSGEGNQTDSARSIAPLGVERDPGKTANEIVFIDSGVEDYETLEAGVRAGVEVLILKDTQDGVTQISQALLGKTGLDAIHLISHGSAGSLQLGSTELSSDRMAHYANALSQIGSSLTETGDIMLYGCDVAHGDVGQEFVLALANATDADVAASIDKTGAMILGGNWVLEYSHGEIGDSLLTKNSHVTNYYQLLDTESPIATVGLEADFLSSTSNSTELKITFSEDPVGFDEGDLILSNGSITAGSYNSSNFTYTALFTADSNVENTGGVELTAGSYEDAAGNLGGGGSDSADIDTRNPTSMIFFEGSVLSSDSSERKVEFEFSEAIAGFDETDLLVSNGILIGFTGSGPSYSATFQADPNFTGEGTVQLLQGSYTDLPPFQNPGVGNSDDISIDTENPSATVDLAATSLSYTNKSTVLTITFTESITGFDAGTDLTVSGGVLSAGSFNASTDIWTATFTANDGIMGTGSVSLTGTYTDLVGNSGSGGSDSIAINTLIIPFEHTVQQGSQTVTIDFEPYSARGPNFEVLTQQDDGTLVTVNPSVVKTFIGTVREHPGAIAAGLVRADGRVFTRISFEDGMEWYSAGGEARVKGELNEVIWPSVPTLPGGAGGQVYAAEVGVDVDSYYLEEFGGRDASLEMVEYSTVVTNAIYIRDVGIEHRLGRLVLRESTAANPYDFELDPNRNFLDVFDEVKNQWREVLPSGSEDVVNFVSSRGYGGWAELRKVGSPVGVSTNMPLEPFEEGDFSNIWRHEVGHNWGASHFEGGAQTADQVGRAPEWKTIMSGNQLSRLSVSEAGVILGYRDEITDSLDLRGPFTLPIPPRASMDRYIYIEGQRFDVLQNDHDSNGQQIALSDFQSVSQLGGSVERSIGSGPDGRDELIYRAPEDVGDWDYDRFTYRIEDSEGLQALGNVIVWNRGATAGLTDTDGDGQPDTCTDLLVSGFGGVGESYTRVDASGEPSGLSSLEGEYIRFPEENGYHRGKLIHVADNIYLWTNAIGGSWQMTLDTEKFMLVDEVGSPYELTRSLSYYDLSNCGGMIEDTDDDNDGYSDVDELTNNQSDPEDANSTPPDTDVDFVSDLNDTDDDGDGVEDSADAFPLDPTESVDTDNDGIGNNADAFPLDPTESVDTDNDGIGNNADTDDDGDGVDDNLDIAPLDNTVAALPTVSPTDPGTESNPYLIGTLAELEGLSRVRTYWASGVHLMLTADIDAADTTTWNIGDHDSDPNTPDEAMGFVPIGVYPDYFKGTFDGGGYVVSNLMINREGNWSKYQADIGLFGAISGAVIQRIGLTDASVTGRSYVGGLVGYATEGSLVMDSYVTGDIVGLGNEVGGLIGRAEGSTVTGSFAQAFVLGLDGAQIGGLVGWAKDNSLITESYAAGVVNGEVWVGGLVGDLTSSVVSSSYATSSVAGDTDIGGLVGVAYGTIENSYAMGIVSGNSSVGGLVGYNAGTIVSSYVSGTVPDSGSNIGRLVGRGTASSNVTASYWNTETSGVPLGIGLNDGLDASGGLSNDEMVLQSSFVGFSFLTESSGGGLADNPWFMVEGVSKPFLWWQDEDRDGVKTYVDAFPDDPSESLDTDGDGIGNNADTDDDGDGVNDGADAFPLDATEAEDSDSDGVGDNGDAFPDNPNESVDADQDGVGANADVDDTDPESDSDNDGLSDTAERNYGSDPLLADTDGDGFIDGEEVAAGTSPTDIDDTPMTEEEDEIRRFPLWLIEVLKARESATAPQ